MFNKIFHRKLFSSLHQQDCWQASDDSKHFDLLKGVQQNNGLPGAGPGFFASQHCTVILWLCISLFPRPEQRQLQRLFTIVRPLCLNLNLVMNIYLDISIGMRFKLCTNCTKSRTAIVIKTMHLPQNKGNILTFCKHCRG